jgi:cyclopropane fatty-acyl-phospholipid synthase-like methyltransferase
MPQIEQQKSYYNDLWGKFEHGNSLEMARLAKVMELAAGLEFSGRPKICDLGCGVGWSTGILGIFGDAVGVDLSDVSRAQLRFPYCQFQSANLLEWEHPRDEFDLVVSMEVLEHIERRFHGKYIQIAYELLKPGGHLILTTPNKRTMDAFTGRGRTYRDQPIEDWVTAGELRSLLTANRFTPISSNSLLLGYGDRGLHRIVNSYKVRHFLGAIGLRKLWEGAACWANYGLHLIVLARKI